MAINFCSGCHKRHKDISWRTFVEDNNIVNICSIFFKPINHESVPQRVKDERPKYAKSTLQPFRQGEASAEFIEAYPEVSKKMFTTKERLTAKEVWKNDISPHWRKSK
jgi:hypothetical protein